MSIIANNITITPPTPIDVDVLCGTDSIEIQLQELEVDVQVQDTGASAYDVWLSQGNTGTITDYLNSLKGGRYEYAQSIASSVWVIAHNLGYYPGGITVIDTAGDMVIGSIVYNDINTLTITFSAAFSGTAYLS